MKLGSRLSGERKREADVAAPKRSLHGSFYQRFFADYDEYLITDEKGKPKVLRIYQGVWRIQQLTKVQRIRHKFLLAFLILASAVAFGLIASQNNPINHYAPVAALQLATLVIYAFILIGLVNYCLTPEKMSKGEYEIGELRMERGCRFGIWAMALHALAYFLSVIINTESRLNCLVCSVAMAVPALLLYLANRLSTGVPYEEQQSTDTAPAGAEKLN